MIEVDLTHVLQISQKDQLIGDGDVTPLSRPRQTSNSTLDSEATLKQKNPIFHRTNKKILNWNKMPSESSSEAEINEEDRGQKAAIREELSSMTFEEIMKLKEELGTKVYKEAVLGEEEGEPSTSRPNVKFKRLNKNRPREQSSKRQVPFFGTDKRMKEKDTISNIRDPRFDENSGEYDTKQFKENYKFLTDIRKNEIAQLQKQLQRTVDEEQRKQIKKTIQTLVNKNVEDLNWHKKQSMLQMEKEEMQKARTEGRQPHYVTKKERRAKELVQKFEELQKMGKLTKHLEKRRKKNAAKDRKKFSFD